MKDADWSARSSSFRSATSTLPVGSARHITRVGSSGPVYGAPILAAVARLSHRVGDFDALRIRQAHLVDRTVLAVVLLVAGGLLTWANTFIDDQVPRPAGHAGHHDARAARRLASLPAGRPEALEQYAGSPMDTGPEAKAYADHYILVHMNAASDGRTYAEVSGEYVP